MSKHSDRIRAAYEELKRYPHFHRPIVATVKPSQKAQPNSQGKLLGG